MAKAYNLRCVVLSKTKLSEQDLILTMLGESGHQVRAVARGARKPGGRFGARVEPFSVVDLLLYKGKSLDTIQECRCVETNADCRTDVEHSFAADIIAEFLVKVGRDASCGERMFPLTTTALASIGRQTGDVSSLFSAAFLVKAVAMLGYRPAIHECALCGAPVGDRERFSIEAGGVVCDDCSAQAWSMDTDLDPILIDWVDLLLHSTFRELEDIDTAPIEELLDFDDRWIRQHLSLELRSIGLSKNLI